MGAASRPDRRLPTELAELGAVIRTRRKQLGLTLQAVAPHGDHTHLSRVERGLDWPSRDLIVHLEQVLTVPRGALLKVFIEACEPKRHATQARYRRSGRPTASLATAETPLLLVEAETGSLIRRLVPPMVPDYRADEPRPYRLAEQAIHHEVDADNRWMRTTYRWTIETLEDGVGTFDFVLTPPVGRNVDHLEVAIISGGELDRVERHGATLFHYWLTRSDPVACGRRWMIEVTSGVFGLTYQPGCLMNTVYEPVEAVELEVTFASRLPSRAWWFDALPHDGAPGMPGPRSVLHAASYHRIIHNPVPGYAHGFGWLW